MRELQHAAHIRETRNACSILDKKSQAKRPPERHKHSWEDNNKVGLSEIGYEYLD
jgi:hypothetical protein